jgi:hypothetical protein
MTCHYDPSTERFSDCDGHHRCICAPVCAAVARCSCGRPYSDDAWRALPWDGDQPSGIGTIMLEMRCCVCGSTICRARRGSEYIPAEEWAEIQVRADMPLAETGLTLEVPRP